MILSCCGDDMSKDNEQLIRDALSDIRDSLRDLDNQVDSMDKNLVAYRVAFDHHIQQDEKMYEEFKRMNDILMTSRTGYTMPVTCPYQREIHWTCWQP